MTAAQHAMAEGDYPLAAKRLIYARDAEPSNPSVLRLMTLAFWQAGDLSAAGRAVRDWARVEGERPAPHRFAARIYEDMGAIDLAAEAADRAAARGPEDADAWERVGRLRLRLMDREAAISALEHARRLGPSVEGLLDLALAHHLAGDLGAEVTATEQATLLDAVLGAGVGALRARARAHRSRHRRDRGRRARLRPRPRRRRGRRPARAPAPRRCRACCPRREGSGPTIATCSGRRRPGSRSSPSPRPTSSSSSRAGRPCRRWTDPGLRVVQVLSAGVDWIADRVPAGVTLCSARGARDRAMAEWVMAAILADAKGAREVAEQQARRHWELVKLGDASNLRVLVLGLGSIGRALATMLAAFDCEVVGVARRARDGIHGTDELPALLPEADVVVNLLPLTEATRAAVGAPAARAPCATARSTSTPGAAPPRTPAPSWTRWARGASARCSTSSIPSRCPPDHPLWTAPGVVISPHSAGDTPGADRAAWALAAAQLRRYAAGEELENVVSDGY